VQTSISFPSGSLILEGVITVPDTRVARAPIVVVCHDHPYFKGDMHQDFVNQLCGALSRSGFASLRFNFRGVGGSEGVFTNGREEGLDIKAALEVASHWPGLNNKQICLLGYSFGASVILSNLKQFKDPIASVLISLPPSSVQNGTHRTDPRPRLFLSGDVDRVAPVVRLRELVSTIPYGAELVVADGVDHTWRAHEERAATETVQFFLRVLN